MLEVDVFLFCIPKKRKCNGFSHDQNINYTLAHLSQRLIPDER